MAKPLSEIFRSTLKKKREASLYFFSRARVARRFDSHPVRKSRSSAVPLRFIIFIFIIITIITRTRSSRIEAEPFALCVFPFVFWCFFFGVIKAVTLFGFTRAICPHL